MEQVFVMSSRVMLVAYRPLILLRTAGTLLRVLMLEVKDFRTAPLGLHLGSCTG